MPESIKLLTNLLDYCGEKNRVIAKNIANIGTENYKREDVIFRDVLNDNFSSVMKSTEGKHLQSMVSDSDGNEKFKTVYDENEDMVSGVNNVNIEREMAEMAENSLRFKFASKKVNEYFKVIQSVIKGSGGSGL